MYKWTFCIYVANLHKSKLRKVRDAIPSIPGYLEKIRRDPYNTKLGMYDDKWQLYNNLAVSLLMLQIVIAHLPAIIIIHP